MLLDLKHLLLEAKQKVPPFLLSMQPDNEKYLDIGGTYFINIEIYKLVLIFFKINMFDHIYIIMFSDRTFLLKPCWLQHNYHYKIQNKNLRYIYAFVRKKSLISHSGFSIFLKLSNA